MAKALGVLSCITAVCAVMATLSVVGAVASGLPAGIWTSVIIVAVWLVSAALVIGAVLLMFGQRHAGVVLKPSSFALAIIGSGMTIQALRVGDNLPLMWWLVLFPTLLALLCAAGSIALRTAAPR
jgi:hypothetical protein